MNHGREKAVKFGTASSLVGIVTEAATGTSASDAPMFVMLNSGILHRVGSCRLHVRLARALSAAGFASLRFDYSGIGDSEPRRDSLPFEESAVLETREAMDYLAKTKGARHFVLMGLCSGADMAHETALVDDRVAGLVMLDAWAYRTLAHHLKHYGPRLFKLGVWRNAIAVRWRRFRGGSARGARPGSPGVEHEVATYVRVFPPRGRVERDLHEFVRRGIRMFYTWTGGLAEHYNYRGQFAAAFRSVRFGSLLREEHLADSDHILSGLHHQERFVSDTVDWARGFDVAAPRAARGENAEEAPRRATSGRSSA